MSHKNNLRPAPKTRVKLKKIILFGAGAIVLSGIIWKIFFATAVTTAPGKLFAQFTPGSGPQVTGYQWEATLTIDHAQVLDTGNIINFPLLVCVTNPDLKSVSNGGNVESNYGYDITFAGGNDAKLDHQLESYDPSTGKIVAWVRLPILYKDIDTELKIMCGDASITADQSTDDVWGAGFEGVWHMDNDPSNSELDDAAGNYNAQSHGSMTSSDVVAGKIGKAIDFDGYNDFFSIKNKHFSGTGSIAELSVSAWVQTTSNQSSWTSNWSILDFDRSETFNFFVHGQGKISFCSRNSSGGIQDFHAGSNGQVNDGEWHFVTATFDGSKKRLYIDGVLVGTVNNPSSTIGSSATRYGFIGDGSEASSYNGGRNNRYYDGKIDELRMYSVAISPGRIATEYNNQSNPASFINWGSPIDLPIELGEFRAELDGDQVITEWTVLTQRNNDYFTIERSTDGEEFVEIGTVKGAGTTTHEKVYDFIDYEPEPGLNYYRLTQTDYDGKFETFYPVAVEYEVQIDEITLDKAYPNPFTNSFKVDYTMSSDAEVQLILMNSNGMQIQGDIQYAYSGRNTYQFQTYEELPAGLYFFNIVQNGETKASTKLLKQ